MATAPARDRVLEGAKLLCAIGPIVSCFLAVRFGWIRGHDWLDSAGQAFGFGAASLFVGYGLVLVLWSHRLGSKIWPRVFAAMFVVAVLAEIAATIGITAANNAQVAAKAEMSRASYTTAQAHAKAEQDEVNRLQALLATQPSMSAAAAQADIDKAKAHPHWRNTGGCKDTPNKTFREFCARFFAAEKALGEAGDRAKATADLAAARERLAAALAGAGSTKITTSAADSQAGILSKVLFGTLTPGAEAVEVTGIAAAFLLSLVYISFGIGNAGLWHLTNGSDAGHRPAPSVSVANDSGSPAAAPSLPAGVSMLAPRAPDSAAVKVLAGLLSGQQRQSRVASA